MIYKAAVSYNVDAAAFANLSGKLTQIIGERITKEILREDDWIVTDLEQVK